MRKPAQLYKDKLQEENTKAWYKPENIFWNGGAADSQIDIRKDNYDCHQFASVNKNDNVIGYISYAVDWAAMSAYNFGIISYKKGNIEFARDIYKAVCDIFEVYHMNRMEWCAYTDNPAIRGYRNFIKKCGGRECAYYRQVTRLQDGLLHDSVSFEILAGEFRRCRKEKLPRARKVMQQDGRKRVGQENVGGIHGRMRADKGDGTGAKEP